VSKLRRTLLAGLLLGVLALGCTRLEEPLPAPPRRDRPDQVFLDARVELQEGALVRGAISARRMEQQRRRSLVSMTDSVEVVSWDSLGRAESLTLCDTLTYRRDRQDMSAAGRVRLLAASDPQGKRLDRPGADGATVEAGVADLAALRRRPPFQLLTPYLEWQQRIRKIQTEAAVVFYTPYDTLRGVGFRSDRNLRNWEIRQPVGVTHRVQGGGSGGSRAGTAPPPAWTSLPPASGGSAPSARPAPARPGGEPTWTVRKPVKPTKPAPAKPKPKPTAPVPLWPRPGGF
jgi:hypothetical protein